jgi:hypothetical protein
MDKLTNNSTLAIANTKEQLLDIINNVKNGHELTEQNINQIEFMLIQIARASVHDCKNELNNLLTILHQ